LVEREDILQRTLQSKPFHSTFYIINLTMQSQGLFTPLLLLLVTMCLLNDASAQAVGWILMSNVQTCTGSPIVVSAQSNNCTYQSLANNYVLTSCNATHLATVICSDAACSQGCTTKWFPQSTWGACNTLYKMVLFLNVLQQDPLTLVYK
jgi:hypothetical protein